MISGKQLAMTTAGVATLGPADPDRVTIHRIRLETSVGFDRTITFKKRPFQNATDTAVAMLAAWYKKESDGTVASAALTPGASNKSEYLVEAPAGYVTIEVTGGTAGTVDAYWASVTA
jgi:hypothetical protein